MRKLPIVVLLMATISSPAIAQSANYVVIKEKDRSFGNIRSRITLEVEVPDTRDPREVLEAMMQAAVDRHRRDWPDAVKVRLWNNYEKDQVIQNSLNYAPDGCGWSGDPCSRPTWTDLHTGEIPPDMLDFGKLEKTEIDEAEDVICRNDLQCWGEKHALRATFVCEPLIESFAKYAHNWTDGWFGAKLERFRWNDRTKGSISYSGDEIEFQNGFGGWQKMTYWCHYDPATEQAEVSVH